jgi:hypothetical protein
VVQRNSKIYKKRMNAPSLCLVHLFGRLRNDIAPKIEEPREEMRMSSNPRQTFGGITRAIFARLRKKASKAGIQVASPKGEAVKDGVRIRWNYDAGSELLEVECRAPFWIDENRIKEDLRQEIEAAIRWAA